MSTLLTFPVPSRQLIWSCTGASANLIKNLSPNKKLACLAEEIARYCKGVTPSETLEQAYLRRMKDATNLAEYETCTVALDEIQGHNSWKQEQSSIESDYRPALIQAHAQILRKAIATSDLAALHYHLRTSISRDLGGMNSLRLYKHSWFGTKSLIDDYINTVLEAIDTFVDLTIRYNLPNSELRYYLQSLEDTMKFYGQSALTLSGGAILGMKHIGVVKTLWEADLLPDVISGASAGAIVAAIVGTAVDEAMYDILERFPHSDLAVFDPTPLGRFDWAKQRLRIFTKTGRFFSMDNLERVMKIWLGDITFREAHYKTGRVVNICVSSSDSDEPRLLNYVTAPDVYVWSAVCASCAVPHVFAPVDLYQKDPVTKKPKLWMKNAKQTFVDGSLDHDIPMKRLSQMFNVNFFIVSQVNPHVRMFLEREEEFVGVQPRNARHSRHPGHGIKDTLRLELIHRAQQIKDLGIPRVLSRWGSVLEQRYTGDINIFPEIETGEYLKLMANPTSEYMIKATVAGERATWPKMCRIKNCVAVEMALMRGIYNLRERINFGPEARAAREAGRPRSRGRTPRGRSAKAAFLRRRSLSIESPATVEGLTVPPPSLKVRRNASMNNILFKPLTLSATPPKTTPLPSPYQNIDGDGFSDAMMMTTITMGNGCAKNGEREGSGDYLE
ncbi:hypothetical protein B0A52_04515 [Exophiala mesophila]|uniref:PNPLA domain-containing protein n=1 Tax=Exophiala mesophila TaxID=212818 RepID=A0A438N956_EXOME|nr:hypothetical protein B0A52_04515 [Exophiala mesophila]